MWKRILNFKAGFVPKILKTPQKNAVDGSLPILLGEISKFHQKHFSEIFQNFIIFRKFLHFETHVQLRRQPCKFRDAFARPIGIFYDIFNTKNRGNSRFSATNFRNFLPRLVDKFRVIICGRLVHQKDWIQNFSKI